jgi:chaperone BCS1
MFWLSSRPQFRQSRNFSVSTFGSKNSALEIDDNVDEGLRWRTPPIRYQPSYSSYRMWYKGRYITISRTKEESRWGSDKSILEITSVSSGYINCLIFERLAEYFPAIVLS